MELLLNDLSFEAQFRDVSAFELAFTEVMMIRTMARRFGRDVRCARSLVGSRVTPHHSLPQAVGQFAHARQQSIMQWLARQGPYWEDERTHAPDDYLECNGTIVTDSAVGEAAYCCLRQDERQLVSLTSSSWLTTPVAVIWRISDSVSHQADVVNHWSLSTAEAALELSPVPTGSWPELFESCKSRFSRLTFSDECFSPLRGFPFVPAAADRITVLLSILHELVGCFDSNGRRTPRGQQLYQDFFTGDGALFSDSSPTEKREFREALTFPHPAHPGESLVCGMHGKIRTHTLRLHFSWSMQAGDPLYVMYVGQKLTRS